MAAEFGLPGATPGRLYLGEGEGGGAVQLPCPSHTWRELPWAGSTSVWKLEGWPAGRRWRRLPSSSRTATLSQEAREKSSKRRVAEGSLESLYLRGGDEAAQGASAGSR